MSWTQLNSMELQAARKQLFLDVSEAAKHVGGVSPRSWQRWEDGSRTIPPDVDNEMYRLVQVRSKLVDHLIEQQVKQGVTEMPYFPTFEDYQSANVMFPLYVDNDEGGEYQMILKNTGVGTVPEWRMYQSAVAFVFIELGDIEIIGGAND